MKNVWKWILSVLIILLVLFFLPALLGYLRPFGYGYGMMGGYSWHPMMGGYGMMPFGMFFMWLIPLGTLFLFVLGIVWLVNSLTGAKTPARTCPHCGRPAQADWTTCPYCGKAL